MENADLLCFSHLRWNFVYQRPNHLMSRCAGERRVFFVEEPVQSEGEPELAVTCLEGQLLRVVPHLPVASLHEHESFARLLSQLYEERQIERAIHWYYSPMFVNATRALPSVLTVYD